MKALAQFFLTNTNCSFKNQKYPFWEFVITLAAPILNLKLIFVKICNHGTVHRYLIHIILATSFANQILSLLCLVNLLCFKFSF